MLQHQVVVVVVVSLFVSLVSRDVLSFSFNVEETVKRDSRFDKPVCT